MKVIPAILPKTIEELKGPLDKLLPHFDTFHIDISDEAFVSQNTLGVEDIINTILSYPNTTFDFHLMVFDFGRVINYLRNYTGKIKIGHVFVHHKAMPPKTLFDPVSGPFMLGLTINPDEEVKKLSTLYSFEKIAAVQIMSVVPGAQGQDFIKDSLRKIEQLRLLNYRKEIFIDGGVNNKTIPFILSQKFAPDSIVVGSFLTRAQDLNSNIKFLKDTIPA